MINKIMEKNIFFSLKLSFVVMHLKEKQNDCNIIHFIKSSKKKKTKFGKTIMI